MSTLALRGSARVIVRQHRVTLWTVAALMAVGVALIAATRLLTAWFAERFSGTGCSVEHTVLGCGDTVRSYLDDQYLMHAVQVYAGLIMLILPVLVGAFAAGPLIARELETGTYKLAWSQSVTPARWLAAKLAVPAVPLLVGVSALSVAFTWARERTGAEYPAEWFDGPVFVTMGIAPLGYALLGLTAGALMGLLIRRTVPSMAAAALAVGAVVVIVGSVRKSLWPSQTATGALDSVSDPWILETGQLTSRGERLPVDVCWGQNVDEARCVAERGITGRFADYHPASHFWPLQLVETGIVLALATLAVAVAFRVLRRRAA
ncbi:hypothetical protein [Streptomyces sp. NPDC088746]|uniref:hypothetical protein n=1 Tax=Streptomyces sp. NPDC088746 TaxID=3365885 RepID=UPI003824D8B0